MNVVDNQILEQVTHFGYFGCGVIDMKSKFWTVLQLTSFESWPWYETGIIQFGLPRLNVCRVNSGTKLDKYHT
jgi:hypothetical protein